MLGIGVLGPLTVRRGPAYVDPAESATAEPEVARLAELRLLALEGRLDADLDLLRPEAAVVELGLLVDEYPLRERLRAQLMVALYRSGRQAEALETDTRARGRLLAEAGVEPGEELRRVQDRVLAQDPSLDAPRRPLGITPGPLADLLGAVRSAGDALSAAGRNGEQAALLLAFARALNSRPAAHDHRVWLAEFDAAHDRLLAAAAWAVGQRREDVALGLAVELARYWDHRRPLDVACDTLERVVTSCRSATARRSEALTWSAFFLFEAGVGARGGRDLRRARRPAGTRLDQGDPGGDRPRPGMGSRRGPAAPRGAGGVPGRRGHPRRRPAASFGRCGEMLKHLVLVDLPTTPMPCIRGRRT